MSVRARPSALYRMPSCVVVARGTLDPLALVRIQARQPVPPKEYIDLNQTKKIKGNHHNYSRQGSTSSYLSR